MSDTIFSKIIRREIPAIILYEDEHTLAFLDIDPHSQGHTLVVSKKEVSSIFDVDSDTLTAVMETVRKIAPAVRDGAGATGIHIISNHGEGQQVPHLHFHIIPRNKESAFDTWSHIHYTEGEAEKIADDIRARL